MAGVNYLCAAATIRSVHCSLPVAAVAGGLWETAERFSKWLWEGAVRGSLPQSVSPPAG
jgi:hypothetical protein